MKLTRRDFLKFGSVAAPLAFCKVQEEFDLQAAFAALGDGGVLDIPPGVYEVSDTLKPGGGNYHIIRGNNAIIVPVGNFADKSVVDLSSVKYGRFDNLRVLAGDNDSAFAGIYMGRGASDGAGHVLNQCVVQGSFTGAVLVNEGAEGYTLNNCNLVTMNNKPAYVLSGAIAGAQHNTVAFRNYGGQFGVVLVDLYGSNMSGIVFNETCYWYVGTDGAAFRSRGTHGVIARGRVEGDGADSRLLVNYEAQNLYGWTVENVNYTIPSDYMIETGGAIHQGELDFIHSAECRADRYVKAVGTGPRIWRCKVDGDDADWINSPGSVRMSHLDWTQGSPLANPGDNVVHYVG